MTAAEGLSGHRWSAHPWRARGVRLLVYVVPIALSLAVVHAATSVVRPPTASLELFLLWWLGVSALATVVVALGYRASRRLLPLGALLELSLVFPDEAPSRFELALRTGTVESLEDRLKALREAKETLSTQDAAVIVLRLVAALSDHDHITRGHAERVRAYSYLLGRRLGLGAEDLDRLNWSALLHDIGKLEVDKKILNRSGPPTDEEWERLRLHPLLGEALVAPLREWLGEWIEAVGQHHEHWDGSGYPRGLAGGEISLGGRVVAIADAYDVMTSARSYKEPASAAEARSELVRCSGSQFDPRLVRAFVDISVSRMRFVVGPLSWLAHAPVLARLTSSFNAAAGGLATVAAVTATSIGGGPSDLPRVSVSGGGRAAPPTQLVDLPVVSPGRKVSRAASSRGRAGTRPTRSPERLPDASATPTPAPHDLPPAAPDEPTLPVTPDPPPSPPTPSKPPPAPPVPPVPPLPPLLPATPLPPLPPVPPVPTVPPVPPVPVPTVPPVPAVPPLPIPRLIPDPVPVPPVPPGLPLPGRTRPSP